MTKKENLVEARANEYIAKIEGHGSLKINWKKGDVKLNVHEGERLFEGILVGRTVEEMHWITPRICGVCPIAHNLASLNAIEDAYNIKVTRSTRLLRRLMQIGQNVQSHILHAVFLALPDYIGIDKITELNKKDPKKFALALSLKELGDEIAYVVAGRSVHPTTTMIGGFHKIPSKEELKTLLKKIKSNTPKALALVKLFGNLEYPSLKIDLELLAQKDNMVLSNKQKGFAIKNYKKNIEEEVKNYSTAKFGSYNGGSYLVGAMARLYHYYMSEEIPEDLAINPAGSKSVSALTASNGIDFKNPFHNNLAQIIEVLLELEVAIEIINNLIKEGVDDSIKKPSKNPPLKGIGAIEAPRGGLYNEIHIKDGIVKYANIITPTVQNLTSMEDSARALLKQHSDKSHKELEHLLEMLIRAYDPCITCSVH